MSWESWDVEFFMEILVDIPSHFQHILPVTLLNIWNGFLYRVSSWFLKSPKKSAVDTVYCTCMCSIVFKGVPTWGKRLRALKMCVVHARCEYSQLILILLLFRTDDKIIMKDFVAHVQKIAGKFCGKQILWSPRFF